MVGIKVGLRWYEIGSSSFLNSWFSSVNYHLENEDWGSKYPIIMDDFYMGKVSSALVDKFKKEVIETREKLRGYKPSQVIWDIDDLDKDPPWGSNISSDITSLGDYYVTSDGRDFYDILLQAIEISIENRYDISIERL